MSEQEREAVKQDGLLPDLVVPHPPLKYEKERVVLCGCADCEAATREWRERTGRF
jgi:hypothetical protein